MVFNGYESLIINSAILSSFLLSVTAHAVAPTAELKVKGKIGLPTCTINAPDGGIYNIGEISASQGKKWYRSNSIIIDHKKLDSHL
uniref:Fimbrial-type adhesion domain-containing protein n=1 Tax=Yersinia enterocolitica W22703 TaxID=913028 RepID=F4MZB9_YEREN|nr:unknown protein [Yersinia enterocolitica W22703]